MQSAIYLNNRACTLIEKDCFEKAIEMLNQALSAVPKDELEESLSTQNPWKSPTRGKYLATSNKRRKELDHYSSFLYSRPAYVSHVPQTEGRVFLSLVIIFNYALCHHLKALREVDHKSKHENLLAALKLYKVAVSMQMEAATFEVDTTYVMAMINNSAHIYEMLHRPRQAKQHLNQMLSSLMTTIERGESDTVDDFDGFFHNATKKTLRSTEVAFAA